MLINIYLIQLAILIVVLERVIGKMVNVMEEEDVLIIDINCDLIRFVLYTAF